MITIGTPRAAADLSEGMVLATVEVAASPERVFEALTSEAVLRWWVRPGVFDTRTWSADASEGGIWHASGLGRGLPYELEGEFIEVNPPRKLVHTWRSSGGGESTVSYALEQCDGGTRVTLRHTGLGHRQTCAATCIGWETSFEELARMFAA